MSIPDGFIEDLNTKIDIIDLIGRYVSLKKAGIRYKGPCPFHADTDPSFTVNPEKNLFFCFGCQAGGDAITFIRKMENLGFVEAIRFIASLYNIPVPETQSGGESKRKPLFEVNEAARELYYKYFSSGPNGAPFRSYMLTRGFQPDTLKAFKIGAAPDSWDFAKKGLDQFKEEDLIKSGILVKNPEKGTVYDRFRHRLMVPIIDTLERTVGFGGRVMEGDGPKYVNSPESDIFKKSELLFGLNLAKETARKENTLIIMEGYTDVMMAWQAGVKNCCAVMGTALTESHIPILKRFVKKVILAFDGDKAGRKAIIKSLIETASSELDFYVANIPKDSDPAKIVHDEGAEALREVILQSENSVDWMIRIYSSGVRKKDLRAKTERLHLFVPYLIAHDSESAREELVRKAAIEFGVQESAINEIADRVKSGKTSSDASVIEKIEKSDDMERNMLICLMAFPDVVAEAGALLDEQDFENADYRSIFKTMVDLTNV